MAKVIDMDTGEVIGEEAEQPEEEFRILDVFGPPSAPPAARTEWLATISAGTKTTSQGGKEIPAASRDGQIYLHDGEGRAPELAAILQREGGKRLTIALASDRLGDILHQRYERYSASSLEAFGDHLSMTVVEGGTRITHLVGSQEYEAIRATCKVGWSLFFCLARWSGQQSQMLFPDGFGLYRLRSTSRNSLASVVGKLQEIQRLTDGRLMGIPLELTLAYRDVADGQNKRRTVPVWTLALKPPEAIQLTSGNFRSLIGAALREGQSLRMLPAPRAETIDDLLAETELPDVLEMGPASDADLSRAQSGDVRCDPTYYERIYFAMVRGTRFASDEERANLVEEYSAKTWTLPDAEFPDCTDSLAEFLSKSSEREASAFIAYLAELLDADLKAARLAKAAADASIEKQRIDTSGVPAASAPGPTIPTGAAALALGSLDDSYVDGSPSKISAAARETAARAEAREASVDVAQPSGQVGASDSATTNEGLKEEAFKPCLPGQRKALEEIATRMSTKPSVKKQIEGIDWAALSESEAGAWIESLQP